MIAKYSISEVQKETGVPTSCIRMWEKRYGWPIPYRDKYNNYRIYTINDIETLKRIKTLLDRGMTISKIIIDGSLVFPSELIKKKVRPKYDFSSIPHPTTTYGMKVRAELEEAIHNDNKSIINEIKHNATEIHPKDRYNAVLGLIELIN